jgi:4-amino-4-deoxy-L-arabinose transferase-like glycosyltransferase
MPSSPDSSAPVATEEEAAAPRSTTSQAASTRGSQLFQSTATFLSVSRNARLLALLGFLATCLVFGWLARQSGVTWDEGVQREYGDLILAWFRSGTADQRALTFHNLYLYGGLFEVVAQYIVGLLPRSWGAYEIRHVLTAFTAALGVAAVYLSGARIAGRQAGFWGAALLASTPSWVGHGFFNSKDIPFGAAVAFVLYATTRIGMAERALRWSDATLAGVCMGAALGIRPGGLFVTLFPTAAALVQGFWSAREYKSPSQWLRLAGQTSARLGYSYIIAWSIMIAAWPWAQLHPFTRPFIATAEAAHFQWGGSVMFRGHSVPSDQLPWTYVPVWFAITLPEMYLVAGCCALAYCGLLLRANNRQSLSVLTRSLFDRSEHSKRLLTVMLGSAFVWVPWLGVLATKPVMYNAHRHVLFFFPPIALCAGLVVHRCLNTPEIARWLRVTLVAALLVTTGVTWRTMLGLQPYEYIYFNQLAGGLANAGKHYDTDYWGNSYREGLAWVVAHGTPEVENKLISLDACHVRGQLDYYIDSWHLQDRFEVSKPGRYRRYYLAFALGECARDGKLVYSVTRQGISLLHVYEYPEPPKKKHQRR